VSGLSEDFVKVAESKDIGPSTMKAVDMAGEKVCIINIEGNYYVIGNVCTHCKMTFQNKEKLDKHSKKAHTGREKPDPAH
jgi:nitrite reductase/ring-hydroxylating ferredoxin subunit